MSDKVEPVVVLEIRSLIGAIGAEHYYGNIYTGPSYTEKVEVRRKMTSRDCAKLNKKDRMDGAWSVVGYRPGELTERFDSIEEVEKTAIGLFRKDLIPQGAMLLLRGKPFSGDPIPALDAVCDEHKESVSQFVAKKESLGGWQRSPKGMRALCNKWDKFLGSI